MAQKIAPSGTSSWSGEGEKKNMRHQHKNCYQAGIFNEVQKNETQKRMWSSHNVSQKEQLVML